MSRSESSVSARTALGLVILAIGLALLGDAVGAFDADRLLRFWPLAVIAVGVVLLWRARDGGPWFPGAVLILVGGAFLLEELGYLRRGFDGIWPLIIILLGLAIMSRGLRSRRLDAADAQDTISRFACLCGYKPQITSQSFRGGNLSVFMGGMELDLTAARPAPEGAVLDVLILMGGIEVRVPRDWNVEARVTPFMGGMEDSTDHSASDPAKRLVIKGFVMMGGVEVKN
jgi:hypothetical protein